MLPVRLRSFGIVIALMFLPIGCADAAPAGGLAARAVDEAKSMPAGRERDVALREISRNLRYADRDHAIEAAAAMSEDYELRTFSPGPDKLTRQIVAHQNEQNSDVRACERFVERLKPSAATAADDERIRDCFSMDAPPGIVPPPIPPFRLILLAADALPPGPTKAQLLYMATWDSVPDRPAGGARDAVSRLRALIPLINGDTLREATERLNSVEVDLIEGRPEDAITRVRQGLAQPSPSDDELFAGPKMQAKGLVFDFLRIGDVERAMRVTQLLPPSQTCSMFDDGLGDVLSQAPRLADGATMTAYVARLQKADLLSRLCPRGLDDDLAVDVWFAVGDEQKALNVATRAGKPLLTTRLRLAIAERRLASGDTDGARAMLRKAVTDPAPPAADQGERSAAARQRLYVIHQLTMVGDVVEAERLASSYPGPGWRGFAYSVIVATANRERAGSNWAGPFLDLQEVPAEY